MSAVIDDRKHHLNFKIATNNLRLIYQIHDNQLGIRNYAMALTKETKLYGMSMKNIAIISQ